MTAPHVADGEVSIPALPVFKSRLRAAPPAGTSLHSLCNALIRFSIFRSVDASARKEKSPGHSTAKVEKRLAPLNNLSVDLTRSAPSLGKVKTFATFSSVSSLNISGPGSTRR